MGVSAAVLANTPNDKLLCLSGPFKNVRVVSVQTSFHFNHCDPAGREENLVIVSVRLACGLPILNKAAILHVIQHIARELALFAHGGGELPAYAFNNATKESAVVEVSFGEPMSPKLMSIRLEDLGVFANELLKITVLLARDNTQAARIDFLVVGAQSKTGSRT